MRIFLYAVLDLIQHSEKETCEDITNHVRSGVATYLLEKYKEFFIDIPKYKIEEADDYFKNQEADFDNADRKYDCRADDGLYLVIRIALNEIS